MLAGLATGCVEAPPATRLGPDAEPFALHVLDAQGKHAPPYALPRRPLLALESARSLDGAALILLDGLADPDLLEDLSDLPLRAAHASLGVAGESRGIERIVWFVPQQALAPDHDYTLALPGSTRVSGGGALEEDGPAFVRELHTAAGPTGGASVIASAPADGSFEVATNVQRVWLVLDGAVAHASEGVWLESQEGLALPVALHEVSCADVDTRGEVCLELALDRPLPANSELHVQTGAALRDAHAAPVEPFRASFRTGNTPDRSPPQLYQPSCTRDEAAVGVGCALSDERSLTLRLESDEPVRVIARLRALSPAQEPGKQTRSEPTEPDDGQVAAQLWAAAGGSLRWTGLPPGSRWTIDLQLIDLADNASTASCEVTLPHDLALLAITEVLADPLGPEPDQEYVEIANLGETAIDLEGFTLSDSDAPRPTSPTPAQAASSRGSVLRTAAALPAGARALVVAEAFDPRSMLDRAPPAATLLVPVGTSLTRSGLANAGEPLYLRDPLDRRVSAAPRGVAAGQVARAGRCLQRVSADPRTADPAAFIVAPCSPGR
jgi:hypothetical protein